MLDRPKARTRETKRSAPIAKKSSPEVYALRAWSVMKAGDNWYVAATACFDNKPQWSKPYATLYSAGATTTKTIFANGVLISTIETTGGSSGGGGSTSTSTIAFDATSTSITLTPSGTVTKTWTHTVSGTNPIIVLTADLYQTATGTGSITSATWNGASFTKATSTRTNAIEAEVWYLVATTTGAKTMSVTVTGSTTAMRLAASSFTGVSPTWPLDVVKSGNGNGGNPSLSITPTMATDVTVSTLSKYGGGGGSGGGATPALVQSTKAHGANSVSFSSAVTSGDTLVVGITVYNQTLAANDITDNKGNTYTKAAEAINGTDHAAIYYAKNVTGGSSFQVSSVADGTIAIHEYSGVDTSAPLDQTHTGTGTSNQPSSGNVTTSNGNELYFGVAWSEGSGAWTAGSGYTLRQSETDNTTYERLATEDAIIASASTTAARFSITSSNAYAAAIATFNPSSTGGGGGSSDATSSLTTLFKSADTATFGGSSYSISTSSGTVTDTWTTTASQDWVMAAIALRPATTTSGGGGGPASTTIRYVANDNISGSSIVTDQTGAVVESLDYYPYGGQRIDTKTNYGGVRNKYAGTVYDALSGLNYMQARYQNSSRGQFVSEDPVFLGDPSQQNLKDPQSLNSYSYANDNPITKSDPTGLLTVLIPGTGYKPQDWSSTGAFSGFISDVGKTFNEPPTVINNPSVWSGADTSAARMKAAQAIASGISNYWFADGETLNIVGLSHGGNIGIEVSQLTNHKIDNLITMGTPVRDDYQPNAAMIGNHIQVFSSNDKIWQGMGGGQTSGSQLAGGLLFGALGWAIGGALNWGELGPAGHQFADAKNINETAALGANPYTVHGKLWSTPLVWTDVNAAIAGH
jgi:RHS repeat-associated protein